jgi:hypothetical protein
VKRTYRVVQFGCGPIGCRIAEYALQRPDIEIVAAVDIDEGKVGRDLGEIAGLQRTLGVRVVRDIAEIRASAAADVAIHATGSRFEQVYPQLQRIAEAGLNVVSTCEELVYPYRKYPKLARDLGDLARRHHVAMLATGINPGFLMDAWPLFMSGVCTEVRAVKVVRVQDAASRRIPFQQKIGAGLTKEEFAARVASGNFGHVGLSESVSMIAAGLRWQLEDVTETIEPVLLDREVRSDYVTVEVGRAAGLRQDAVGWVHGEAAVTLEFQAYIGAREPRDRVQIRGNPNIDVQIRGGTQGDVGTASIVLNAVPRVIEAPAGLHTMKDIPLLMCAR